MKALKLVHAPQSIAMFLMALNIPFRFFRGDFIIETMDDPIKFVKCALSHGVRESDLLKIAFFTTEI